MSGSSDGNGSDKGESTGLPNEMSPFDETLRWDMKVHIQGLHIACYIQKHSGDSSRQMQNCQEVLSQAKCSRHNYPNFL